VSERRPVVPREPHQGPRGVYTASSYTNYGCRCPKCKEAWSQYQRQRREGLLAREEHIADLVADRLLKRLEEREAGNKAMNDAIRGVLKNDESRGTTSVDSVFGGGPEYEIDGTGSTRLKKTDNQKEN
jgi:hypothetical protein